MATQTILKFNRLSNEPVLSSTDQGNQFVYYLFAGVIDVGTVYSPIQQQLSRYFGNLADLPTDCNPPGSVTGTPTWNPPTPPTYKAGRFYQFFVPFSAVTPFTGQQISGINGDNLPGWLAVYAATLNGQVGVSVSGDAPVGLSGSLNISLSAYQFDGKFKPQSFVLLEETATVPATTINAYLQYSMGSPNQAIIRIAPIAQAGQSAPTVSLSGPAGWTNTGTYFASTGGGDVLGGVNYPYYYTYNNLPAGTYTLKVVHLGQTKYTTFTVGASAYEQALTLTDNPPGNQPTYSLSGPASTDEGGNGTVALMQQSGVQSSPVSGASYRLSAADAAITLNASTGVYNVATDDVPGNSRQVTFIASVSGVDKAQLTINIVDKTPYIISIVHQYNPSNETDYFLVKHSVTENDTTRLPVWRCKRTEESNWRGTFVGLYSTEGQYAQFNQGYRLYMQANLSAQGVNQTNGTFQFKPYPAAPDTSIITINVSHNSASAQDYGTEVYHAGTSPWDYDNDPANETDISYFTLQGVYE